MARSVTGNVVRQQAYKNRQRAAGKKQITLWVTDEQQRLIEQLLASQECQDALHGMLGFPIDPDASDEVPVTLRDCIVREIDPPLAAALNRLWHATHNHISKWHVQRQTRKACFALVFRGRAFGVAIYTNPVARLLNDGQTMEFRRLALSPSCPRNSASWLMAHCEQCLRHMFPEIRRLITYSEEGKGKIFATCDWQPVAQVRSHEWNTPSRPRRPSQSTANKTRWEKPLH